MWRSIARVRRVNMDSVGRFGALKRWWQMPWMPFRTVAEQERCAAWFNSKRVDWCRKNG
jgi:hypothetical protein